VPTFIKNYVEESNEFIRQTLSGGQTEPIPQSESSLEEYQKKASLSPWVPAPESVIRRMLDMSKANSNDVSVKQQILNFRILPSNPHMKFSNDTNNNNTFIILLK
jgi:hypothetical protein